MAVERKYERDVDLLLAEELAVNAAFSDWLRRKTCFSGDDGRLTDVFVSKADNLGESDLVAIFTREDGSAYAILIEDKIDAPLQPNQAARYRLRAERQIKLNAFGSYTVMLCAPDFYLRNSSRSDEFDVAISFEEVAAFFRANSDSPRNNYRAAFLETAGTRRTNNWVREIDAATETFWSGALELAAREFLMLEMKQLKVTKGSSWINFRPKDMPTMPHRIYVSVKGDRGHMDLTFSGAGAHRFHGLVSHLLERRMTVHQTGKSAAIRIQVSGFNPVETFERQVSTVRSAFEACADLIRFYRENRSVLDSACEASSASA